MNSSVQFSKAEYRRYSRHLIIPEFNIAGQQRLKRARVLVVGAGGLGCPALLYLTAAGVGRIGIVDFDVVSESNLQRQVLYNVEQIGIKKISAAKYKLSKQNPHVVFDTYDEQLNSNNALDILENYDLIIDGTDNFPTRYLINDACVLLDKPLVYGSIFQFEGQVSVFNLTTKEGRQGPNYRDLFPVPPPPDLVPNCAEGGVLGVLPGIIGSLQASEAIKVITGIGEPLSGRLFVFDALTFTSVTLNIKSDPKRKPVEKLIDYEAFCGITIEDSSDAPVREISVQTLKEWLDAGKDFQLVDVRKPYEYDIVNIGGRLIAMEDIDELHAYIDPSKQVVIHCRTGKRSAQVIETLEQRFGHDNLFNLKGGIVAYADQIDPSLPSY